MTNADKLLKDGVTIEDFEDIYYDWLIKNMVLESEREIQVNKLDSVMRFLRTPCKPTLTDDERVILKNIDEHYRYISREKGGDIRFSFANESFRRSVGCDSGLLFVYNHLFQFIKPRRRIRDKRIIGGKKCYELKKI